jgi:uncharacterized membrane protein YraQ (UPF0718 family)
VKRIDGSLLFLMVFAIGAALACWLIKGTEAFQAAAWHELGMLLQIVPLISGGILLGGFAQALIPQAVVRRWLGEGSGVMGLLIAAGVGAFVPGGPSTSFPLVLALTSAGADAGVVIAFITGWAVLGVNRIVIWELPFMGAEFAVIRFMASLPLPLIAGLLARKLPIAVRPPARGGD